MLPILFPDDSKSIIEALLFVAGEPLSAKQLAEVITRGEEEVFALLRDIKADCERERRGFYLSEVAGGYLFATRPEYSGYVEKIVKPRLSNLSQAALETLAIIAYGQPITRSEIDEIRGVKSDSVIYTLLERGLIDEAGRRDGPGRPILWATTPGFLKYLGLNSIEDLPRLEQGESESEPEFGPKHEPEAESRNQPGHEHTAADEGDAQQQE